MFVRKFEADTLEEALKSIKKELGPDAIILKTITNKGIKGAFKSKKIEITAAISEKSYVKKTSVDKVLDDEQHEKFYNNNANYLSNMIDKHNPRKDLIVGGGESRTGGYGDLGLNKKVNTTKNGINLSLDDFLDSGGDNKSESSTTTNPKVEVNEKVEGPGLTSNTVNNSGFKEIIEERDFSSNENKMRTHSYNTISDNLEGLLENQNEKIKNLENTVDSMKRIIENISGNERKYLNHLTSTLKTFDISPVFINKIIKKLLFELSDEELENEELIFDFCLREMTKEIPLKMPLFSKVDSEIEPTITVLISETSCGQSSMIKKICSLKKDSVLIDYSKDGLEKNDNFSEKIFLIEKVSTSNIAEIVSVSKKSVEKNKSVFIDFRVSENDDIDIKSFIESLKRVFKYVEIILSVSAIHSENYNKKILNKYKNLSDGISISMMDLCTNFGTVFNLSEFQVPFVFFGTGKVIPDDLESSTSERILSGIFQIK